MQTALYGHLIEADLAQIGRESPAALTQRFTTDFLFIKEALTRLSTVFLREVTTIIALIAAMLWIDPVLTLVAGRHRAVLRLSRSTRSAGSCGGSRSRPRSRPARWRASSPRASPAPASPRPTGSKRYLKAKAARTFDDIRGLKMKAANARGRLDPLLEAGGGFAVAAVLVLIGQRILSGGSTVGRFHRASSAPSILAAQPIRALGNLNAIVQEAAAALQRTFAIMDEAPRIQDRPEAEPLAARGRRGPVLRTSASPMTATPWPSTTSTSWPRPGGPRRSSAARARANRRCCALVPRLYDVDQRRRPDRRPGRARRDPGEPARRASPW